MVCYGFGKGVMAGEGGGRVWWPTGDGMRQRDLAIISRGQRKDNVSVSDTKAASPERRRRWGPPLPNLRWHPRRVKLRRLSRWAHDIACFEMTLVILLQLVSTTYESDNVQ